MEEITKLAEKSYKKVIFLYKKYNKNITLSILLLIYYIKSYINIYKYIEVYWYGYSYTNIVVAKSYIFYITSIQKIRFQLIRDIILLIFLLYFITF